MAAVLSVGFWQEVWIVCRPRLLWIVTMRVFCENKGNTAILDLHNTVCPSVFSVLSQWQDWTCTISLSWDPTILILMQCFLRIVLYTGQTVAAALSIGFWQEVWIVCPGDFSLSVQCDCSGKTKAILDLHNNSFLPSSSLCFYLFVCLFVLILMHGQ